MTTGEARTEEERSERWEWVEADAPRLSAALAQVVSLAPRLWRARDLVAAGVRRDLAARLSGTALGFFWPLAAPALYFAVYYVIFAQLFGVELRGLPAGQGAAVGVYMFLGAALWSGFAEALSRATSSLVDHGSLIKKLAFPSEVLPLVVVLSSAITTLLAVLVFVLACLATPVWRAPGIAILWAPVLFALQIAFTYGLALFASALCVSLRDTKEALTVLLTVLMFATPVFWIPLRELVPGLDAWLPWIEANPLQHLLYAWRAALMGGEPAAVFARPIASSVLVLVPWALGALAAGGLFFELHKRRFPDEV